MKRTFLAVFLLFFFFSPLWAERYALVIGNAAYSDIQPLNTPVNDAGDIAAALETLGYNVDLRINVGIEEMEIAVFQFAGYLAKDGANEGFFWYAGHGVQAENENFLLPVDIKAQTITQLKRASFALNDLMTELELARNSVNVVILDACRNNPLPAETRTMARGLAMAPVIQDTFVMFSTAAGATADDGEPGARNSPFTRAFLKYIAEPVVLESVAKEISRETIALTNSSQRPYISDNILFVKDYSLYPREGGPLLLQKPVQSAPASPRRVPRPGSFVLDNTTAWSLALSFASSPGMDFDAMHPGATVRYTFFEQFKRRGEIFFLPNAYFFDFSTGQFHVKAPESTENFAAFTLGLGALWKFRPAASQRFFLAAGPSFDITMGSLQYSYFDVTYKQVSDFLVEPMVGFHGNCAFRFTPLLALELKLAYYLNVLGNYLLENGSSYSLNYMQAALGVSVTLPYGSAR